MSLRTRALAGILAVSGAWMPLSLGQQQPTKSSQLKVFRLRT